LPAVAGCAAPRWDRRTSTERRLWNAGAVTRVKPVVALDAALRPVTGGGAVERRGTGGASGATVLGGIIGDTAPVAEVLACLARRHVGGVGDVGRIGRVAVNRDACVRCRVGRVASGVVCLRVPRSTSSLASRRVSEAVSRVSPPSPLASLVTSSPAEPVPSSHPVARPITRSISRMASEREERSNMGHGWLWRWSEPPACRPHEHAASGFCRQVAGLAAVAAPSTPLRRPDDCPRRRFRSLCQRLPTVDS